jgi:hypothetical protein
MVNCFDQLDSSNVGTGIANYLNELASILGLLYNPEYLIKQHLSSSEAARLKEFYCICIIYSTHDLVYLH